MKCSRGFLNDVAFLGVLTLAPASAFAGEMGGIVMLPAGLSATLGTCGTFVGLLLCLVCYFRPSPELRRACRILGTALLVSVGVTVFFGVIGLANDTSPGDWDSDGVVVATFVIVPPVIVAIAGLSLGAKKDAPASAQPPVGPSETS